MSSTETINALLYEYAQSNELHELNMNEARIEIDNVTKHVRFVSKDCSTTLTIFSTANTMRYIPYTIDTMMGTIISMFGYQSELHRVIAVFVQYTMQSNIKK